MLKGNVLSVEERQINGKPFFKTLIGIQYGENTILCEKYLQECKERNKVYEVLLDRTNDLKYLNVKLGKEILSSNSVDDSKKGIFNK